MEMTQEITQILSKQIFELTDPEKEKLKTVNKKIDEELKTYNLANRETISVAHNIFVRLNGFNQTLTITVLSYKETESNTGQYVEGSFGLENLKKLKEQVDLAIKIFELKHIQNRIENRTRY